MRREEEEEEEEDCDREIGAEGGRAGACGEGGAGRIVAKLSKEVESTREEWVSEDVEVEGVIGKDWCDGEGLFKIDDAGWDIKVDDDDDDVDKEEEEEEEDFEKPDWLGCLVNVEAVSYTHLRAHET